MYLSTISNNDVISERTSGIKTEGIKREFFLFFGKKNFKKRRPLPLISKYFPSSFVISAGPDLGDEYYNLAHTKENYMLLQPCARYWDVKDSGDGRHLALFEMSAINDFGYDGRKNIIKLFLDFFMERLGLSINNLCATYFEGGIVAKRYYQNEDSEFKQIIREIYPQIPIYKVNATEGFVANSMEPFGGRKVEFYYIDHMVQCGLECGGSPESCSCGKYLEICTTITYDYIVEHSKDKQILNLKEVTLDRDDIISVIGFGVERVASIVNNRRYSLNNIEPFFSILNGKKYIVEERDFKYIDLIRSLTFLISDMKDKLVGKRNKERRWCFNKYRNKQLIKFVNEDLDRAKYIIKTVIENHKNDDYTFKSPHEILDTIVNWR